MIFLITFVGITSVHMYQRETLEEEKGALLHVLLNVIQMGFVILPVVYCCATRPPFRPSRTDAFQLVLALSFAMVALTALSLRGASARDLFRLIGLVITLLIGVAVFPRFLSPAEVRGGLLPAFHVTAFGLATFIFIVAPLLGMEVRLERYRVLSAFHPVPFASALMIATLLSYSNVHRGCRPFLNSLLCVIGVLALARIGVRGALLGMTAGLLVGLAFRRGKVDLWMGGLLVVILAGIGLLITGPVGGDRFQDQVLQQIRKGRQSATTTRLEQWTEAARQIASNPLLGPRHQTVKTRAMTREPDDVAVHSFALAAAIWYGLPAASILVVIFLHALGRLARQELEDAPDPSALRPDQVSILVAMVVFGLTQTAMIRPNNAAVVLVYYLISPNLSGAVAPATGSNQTSFRVSRPRQPSASRI